MMERPTDFFFGDVYYKREVAISLTRINSLLSQVPKHFAIQQINRLLMCAGGTVIVNDGTSYPDFADFLSVISCDDVGKVEISSRSDINENVNATLYVDLYFASGVVSIRPHWCAYKDIRSHEILTTLLLPLYEHGLHTRSFLVDDGTGKKWLFDDLKRVSDLDETELLTSVFSMAKYPLESAWFDSPTAKKFVKTIEPMCK